MTSETKVQEKKPLHLVVVSRVDWGYVATDQRCSYTGSLKDTFQDMENHLEGKIETNFVVAACMPEALPTVADVLKKQCRISYSRMEPARDTSGKECKVYTNMIDGIDCLGALFGMDSYKPMNKKEIAALRRMSEEISDKAHFFFDQIDALNDHRKFYRPRKL